MIKLICPVCNSEFERSKTQYNSNIKRGRSNCCSNKCACEYGIIKLNRKHPIKTNCENCNKEYYARNSDYKKSKRHFCSQSCSGIFYNRLRNIGRSIKQKISKPRILVTSKTHFASNYTKKYLFTTSKNWQTARSTIRKHAERVFKESKKEKVCAKCGYNKTVQIAHIKSVSSFPDNSLLIDINQDSNLVALCPNCHWELDHGLIKI